MDPFERIGADIGIKKDSSESENSYRKRIILSMLSDWMQTAVHTGEEVSVVSVKQTAMDKLGILKELYQVDLGVGERELVDYIYDVLLKNGVFLHKNYRLRPAPHLLIGDDRVALIRGMEPEENVSFTGLAPYIEQPAEENRFLSTFGLFEKTPEEIFNMVWRHSVPVTEDEAADEFLNVNREQRQPYYQSGIKGREHIQYARKRMDAGSYDYYILRGKETRRIQEDYKAVHLHDYVRLHVMNSERQQIVNVTKQKDGTVNLRFAFHLPEPDLRFLRLIAWPSGTDITTERWNFCIQNKVWPLLKKRLEFLEYKVVEQYA